MIMKVVKASCVVDASKTLVHSLGLAGSILDLLERGYRLKVKSDL
jgi:hypothetical protein